MKADRYYGKEIIRFVVAGAIVTGTDFSIYYLLFHFLPFSIAKAISFICAGSVGYALNKYWTFKHGRASYLEIGRYTLINTAALGINVLTNQSVLTVLPGAVWPALFVATAVTGLVTFVCFKWWVFKT